MTTKTAVILFNLGGPDDLKSVRPFLFNLFNDPAILRVPAALRWMLARLISWKRAGKARGIYQKMGGKSPILEQTQTQAAALEKKLKSQENAEYKVFVSMRYWHPMSATVVKNVKAYAPDRILLLPLYPQFSTTTTASSFRDWDNSAREHGLDVPTTKLCCYPADRGFIVSHVKLIKDAYWKAAESGKPRVLFSAHGLPEKVIKAGDPYQWQVEQTASAIAQILAIDELDHVVCYQSKVGPMKWIGPSTEEEIMRAGADKVPVVVVPVSFVSEHSETLVELDMDYRTLANAHQVPGYWRVPALSTEPYFIDALASLVAAADFSEGMHCFNKTRYCTRNFSACPCGVAEAA